MLAKSGCGPRIKRGLGIRALLRQKETSKALMINVIYRSVTLESTGLYAHGPFSPGTCVEFWDRAGEAGLQVSNSRGTFPTDS